MHYRAFRYVFLLAFFVFTHTVESNAYENLDVVNGNSLILLGVSHETDLGWLFNQHSKDEFNKKVIPLLENDGFSPDKTVVIYEGAGDTQHGLINAQQKIRMFGTGYFPASIFEHAEHFINLDYRNPNKVGVYADVISECMPEVLLDLPQEITNDYLNMVFTGDMTLKGYCNQDHFDQELKDSIYDNHSFELFQLQVAKRYQASGYKVLLVVGTAHIPRMHHLMLGQEDKHDVLYLNEFIENTISSATKFTLFEKTYFDLFPDKKNTYPWYNWKSYYFQSKDMDGDIDAVEKSLFQIDDMEVIKKGHKKPFKNKSVVFSIASDLFKQKIDAPLLVGDSLIISLKNGVKLKAKYLAGESRVGLRFIEKEIRYNSVPHKIRIPVESMVFSGKNWEFFKPFMIESITKK